MRAAFMSVEKAFMTYREGHDACFAERWPRILAQGAGPAPRVVAHCLAVGEAELEPKVVVLEVVVVPVGSRRR